MLVIPSYMLQNYNLKTLDLGTVIYDPEQEKIYALLNPGELTQINITNLSPEYLSELIAAGGLIKIDNDIDAPTGYAVTADTTIINNGVLSISRDKAGDGVFKVTSGTLTLSGNGTVNGVGDNAWNMAIWATGNGKVIIEDGLFTNIGASDEEDPDHFDLIYASGNAQIEINGGEFKCQTPKWTLNVKDADRETAKIIVKGGKFHGFDPRVGQDGDAGYLAEGYKVIEENDIYTVVKE